MMNKDWNKFVSELFSSELAKDKPWIAEGLHPMRWASSQYTKLLVEAEGQYDYHIYSTIVEENPESILEAKQEAEDKPFDPRDILSAEEAFGPTHNTDDYEMSGIIKVDDEYVQAKKEERWLQVKPSTVRLNAKEFIQAKKKLAMDLSSMRQRKEDILQELKEQRERDVQKQAKATGVDPKILARVLRDKEYKQRRAARHSK